MGDMDINTILRSGRHSKLKLYRNFTYWFCKHYFGCDIHPDMAMEDTVRIAHNGLGCVINKDAVIAENVCDSASCYNRKRKKWSSCDIGGGIYWSVCNRSR